MDFYRSSVRAERSFRSESGGHAFVRAFPLKEFDRLCAETLKQGSAWLRRGTSSGAACILHRCASFCLSEIKEYLRWRSTAEEEGTYNFPGINYRISFSCTTHTYTYTYVCITICTHVYMYTCMICMSLWQGQGRGRESDRESDIGRGREGSMLERSGESAKGIVPCLHFGEQRNGPEVICLKRPSSVLDSLKACMCCTQECEMVQRH